MFVPEFQDCKHYICKYPECQNYFYVRTPRYYVNKPFFKFPPNPHFDKIWRNICKLNSTEDSSQWRLCEDHFLEADFVNGVRNRLKCGVIPISPDQRTDAFIERESEVWLDIAFNADPLLPKSACSCGKKCLFSHQHLDMQVKTASEIVLTELDSTTMDYLKAHVRQMMRSMRFCCLVFKDLTPNDNTNIQFKYNFGFMLRGCGALKLWKQLIAFHCSNTECDLQSLIKKIILQLQEIEFDITAVVCEYNPSNAQTLKALCSEEHPVKNSDSFFINNTPIVTIFDVPHLLITTRDAFWKSNIEFGNGKIAKFEYLKATYEYFQKEGINYFYSLKPEDLNSENSKKADIAAYQLSHRMAAMLHLFASDGKILPKEAQQTAEFVKKIDTLFDSLNTKPSEVEDYKGFIKRVIDKDSPHLKFWWKTMNEMDGWKIEGDTQFVEGWQTTMRAIIFLWARLKTLFMFSPLDLTAFNLEPLNHLFKRRLEN